MHNANAMKLCRGLDTEVMNMLQFKRCGLELYSSSYYRFTAALSRNKADGINSEIVLSTDICGYIIDRGLFSGCVSSKHHTLNRSRVMKLTLNYLIINFTGGLNSGVIKLKKYINILYESKTLYAS